MIAPIIGPIIYTCASFKFNESRAGPKYLNGFTDPPVIFPIHNIAKPKQNPKGNADVLPSWFYNEK